MNIVPDKESKEGKIVFADRETGFKLRRVDHAEDDRMGILYTIIAPEDYTEYDGNHTRGRSSALFAPKKYIGCIMLYGPHRGDRAKSCTYCGFGFGNQRVEANLNNEEDTTMNKKIVDRIMRAIEGTPPHLRRQAVEQVIRFHERSERANEVRSPEYRSEIARRAIGNRQLP